ncbi:MAG: AAA family ATPase [Bryobacterales bacterium]|nr:AAA family ATPase [Bryobacterales bacterium]
MKYRKRFDPNPTQVFEASSASTFADRRDGSIYIYTDEIVLAVNVALATGRPLLVRGPSGCGKSTLARNVARWLGRRYYEQVISSRTQARDLLWEMDLLRRLQDAQAGSLAPDNARYVRPGILWWAFDRRSAAAQVRRAGASEDSAGSEASAEETAVVLLDEIDKADPDVPNNLLVPLGSLTFRVDETGDQISALVAPLVLITTNDERDLPPAFVRRCVELRLPAPTKDQLVTIGRAHMPEAGSKLLDGVAAVLASSDSAAGPNPPSTAEYLDTVRACLSMGVDPGSDLFDTLSKVTLWKHGRGFRGRAAS